MDMSMAMPSAGADAGAPPAKPAAAAKDAGAAPKK
jgi:hypothetical protein